MTSETAHVDLPGPAVREALVAAGYTGAARVGRDRWTVHDADAEECTVTFWRRTALEGAVGLAFDDRVRRLRDVTHPHLCPVVAVVEAGGELAVIQRGASGAILADVLERRGLLTAGEVVTLVVPVAQALAVLHGAGLVHGALDAADVVVDLDGRAHLRPRLLPAPPDLVRQDDVRALAALARRVLDDDAPGAGPAAFGSGSSSAVAEVLGDVLSPPAGSRATEAGTIAARAAEVAPAEPIRSADPGSAAASALAVALTQERPRHRAARGVGASRVVTGEVRRPSFDAPAEVSPATDTRPSALGDGEDTVVRLRREVRAAEAISPRAARRTTPQAAPVERAAHRRWGAWWVGAAAVLVVVAGGIVVLSMTRQAPDAMAAAGSGARSATSSSPTPTTRQVATEDTRDPAEPAAAAAALTRAHPAVLAGRIKPDQVTLAGSPARSADDALVSKLGERGAFVSLPVVHVTSTRVVVAPAGTGSRVATVDVTYTVGATTLRGKDGTVTPVAATGARTDSLVLAWTTSGWRVRAVQARVG